MEKLHSQLPQPLKRSSPSRHADLLTQIKNSNSPLSNRSPARRTVTSSPNSTRSRDTAVVTLTSKQPEVKARSPEVLSRSRDAATTSTRRPIYSSAANGNMSPVARGKISMQQHTVEAAVSDTKQSSTKTLAARLPAKTKSAQQRTLRPTVDSSQLSRDGGDNNEKDERAETVPLWTQNSQPGRLGTVCGIKKSLSPKCERRGDFKKVEQPENMEYEDKNNGGGGSPIYHELDPPGTYRFPVQHTYQSIVEINDELESLRVASMKPEDQASSTASQQLSRAKSAQELTQKSPNKLSLFSRFRFATKKSSAKTSDKAERTVCPAEVKGQSSLQDVNLITRSRDEDGVSSSLTSHDRQPSFTTFAHRLPQLNAAMCDSDGYSCVYVPQNLSERHNTSAPVPPRTSSLIPHSNKPASEPLYKQKFLKIASVHTLQSPAVADDCGSSLTSSNSVGDLLLATDIGHQSPRRVTSYDDQAVGTGSRKMAASVRKHTDYKSQIARFGLSPGRGSSFSSPSCGIRMAEMRGAARRCTNDVSLSSPTTSMSRSPSASTPVPSPAGLSVFQFSVPPPGVMMSPPVHRAYRHVSSQTVTSVRPPSASCVLSVTVVHSPGSGPVGQMQTIEEEEDDSVSDELRSTSDNVTAVDQQPNVDDRTRRSELQAASPAVRDDVEQSRVKVAGRRQADDERRKAGDDGAHLQTQSEVTSVLAKTSKLRRPAATVALKPLTHGCSSPLPDHQPSRIVPPSVSTHKRTESSSVSPPSTPRSVDSQTRSASARAEPVRCPFTRGQQRQQRKQVAPTVDNDTAITASQIGDGLLVSGVRRPCPRRLLAPTDGPSSANASPNLSSGSSLSLLSNESELDAVAGSSAPESVTNTATSQHKTSSVTGADTRPIQHKHSTLSVTSRVGKLGELTIPAHTDHSNY